MGRGRDLPGAGAWLRLLLALVMGGWLLAPGARAAPQFVVDLVGQTASGTASLTASGGVTPSDNGTFNGTGTAKLVAVDAGTGRATIELVLDINGVTGTAKSPGNASFSLDGSFLFGDSIVWSNGVTSSVSGSGQIRPPASPATISMSLSGSDISGNTRSLSISFSGTFPVPGASSGSTGTEPASVVTGQVQQQTALRTLARSFEHRFSQLRQMRRSGGTSQAGGLQLGRDGLQGGMTGLSGGDWLGGKAWGVWGSVSYTDAEDDFAATSFDSTRWSVLGGLDIAPAPWWVAGVAVGFERSDVDTRFNSGEQDVDGITIAPYASLLLTDALALDLALGYTRLDIDQFRSAGGARVTSNLASDRWFLLGNASYTQGFGPLLVTGRAGLMVATDRQEDFTESDGTAVAARKFKLGQLRLGLDVAYSLGRFEPFAGATFEHDYSRTESGLGAAAPGEDRSGGVVGLGVRYFDEERGLSGSLEYRTTLGRDNLDESSVNLLLRAEF